MHPVWQNILCFVDIISCVYMYFAIATDKAECAFLLLTCMFLILILLFICESSSLTNEKDHHYFLNSADVCW